MLTAVWNGIPGFVGAIVVLAVSFYIGRWISQLVANLLAGIGFDRVLKWVGLGGEPVEGQRTPSEIVGSIVLVGVMLFAVVESAEMIGFNVVTDLVTQVIAFAGQAIVAVVIFGLGLYIANLARSYITSSGMENAKLLGQLSRIAILALVIAMTLGQLGVASEIVNLAFGLLIGAVAVAIALAFGLGGRDIAARKVEGWLAAVSEDDSKE
jgi:hypothetical protein